MGRSIEKALVIGGGIGGLTAAIALRGKGIAVDVIERDPTWSVYGVGIIQQGNVIRAMSELGLIEDYLGAGFGFDHLEIAIPTGKIVAKIPTPRLVEGLPGNVGIGRRALHAVLGARTQAAGAVVRLGVTAETIDDDGVGVSVRFDDGSEGRYDLVIGADGLYSQTRQTVFPEAPVPTFTGQAVWRYNFPRLPDLTGMRIFEGPTGVGLVPLSDTLMYMYVTTAEPGNPWYPVEGIAAKMRDTLAGIPAPEIQALRAQIVEDSEVVYKPLEWMFLEGAWHKGRVVLLGDAIHATTPHLGQGAGMAIEDSIVLADELARADTVDAALTAFHARRFERCRYIVEASRSICLGQLGLGPLVENAAATREMFLRVAEPI
ncbi:FAD-dependent oxidoreductase [Sphingomonas glacialis]|uniref:2-polyprenyl-6-methoxyphenol hydroxylase n=1 Tax=Sphingomonas glacialis TaxID=658225 RepID=A0A502FIP7_9SPHN|nr:FAD-dependent oxidoreductase [Sphingomonas glacialis]TPG49350.1 2-polyprenyl-6-methoxyphenol hydroxylase [Sphingomonas glacialis]